MSPLRKNKLPKNVIDIWPDVFGEVDIKVIPLEYLHSIRVVFKDGKIWDIDIANSNTADSEVNIQEELEGIFQAYENDILNVDFRLDIKRVKEDIKKRTAFFMKKRR